MKKIEKKEYTCPHCEKIGGTYLGDTKDGHPVCDKCGKKSNDTFIHFSEWSWNTTSINNRTKEKKDLDE